MQMKKFRKDIKWIGTAQCVTPLCHFVVALKLSSGDQSQILHDASNEFLASFAMASMVVEEAVN